MGALSLLWVGGLHAQDAVLVASSDVTLLVNSTSSTVATDGQVFSVDENGAASILFAEGGLSADIDGFQRLEGGDALVSYNVTTLLPGNLIALPGDVVLASSGGAFSKAFDSAAAGVGNANVDAVASVGSDLLLSFDTTVSIDGLIAEDEDLVRIGTGPAELFFDGSASGVAPELDVDAAFVTLLGELLVSFDTAGQVGALEFQDEDIVKVGSNGTATLWMDPGGVTSSDWNGPDLNAFGGLDEEVPLFADGFESGDTSAWSP